MQQSFPIYLAGNIRKGHEDTSKLTWDPEHRAFLEKAIHAQVVFLNPSTRTDDLSDQLSVFGRDMVQVTSSHLVFVDVRERRGLGVGAEMMWAKMRKIPVISWAPQESHYRKANGELLGVVVKNWVHPFVESLSDYLAENLEDAAEWINRYLAGKIEIKGPEIVEEAMQHYMQTQFSSDIPMQEIAQECQLCHS